MQLLKNIVINAAMILVMLFGLTVSATAAELSFEEVKALAEKGAAPYQGLLGIYYENGEGVRQDYANAFYWYQKAAYQGYDPSQFSMGYAYANGQGIRQDYSKALEWFEKSASQKNPAAQRYMGIMYEFGTGVRQNKTTAKEWHGKSCDNGYQGGCDSYKRLNEEGY